MLSVKAREAADIYHF